MAAVAEKIADRIIVTDDNPRTEDPAKIISEIMKGFKNRDAVYCERDRYKAIEFGIQGLQENDIFLVAGKGHEDYQIYGTEKQPFCDRSVVKEILERLSA